MMSPKDIFGKEYGLGDTIVWSVIEGSSGSDLRIGNVISVELVKTRKYSYSTQDYVESDEFYVRVALTPEPKKPEGWSRRVMKNRQFLASSKRVVKISKES